MLLAIRALGKLLMNWRAVLGTVTLIIASEFAAERALNQVQESISKLWWILALAVLVILVKEYMRHYFDLKKQQSIIDSKKQ